MIKNLGEVVEMIRDHVWEDDYECKTDEDRRELIVELVEEFFQIYASEEMSEQLLVLARAGHVVEINGEEYAAFTVIPNTQYEVVIEGKSYWYEGSLEDLDSLEQLEVWE